MKPIKHFLIIYSGTLGTVVETKVFNRIGAAVAAYEEAEKRVRGEDGTKVVLIGATSLDVVRVTHSNLWGAPSLTDLARELLEA